MICMDFINYYLPTQIVKITNIYKRKLLWVLPRIRCDPLSIHMSQFMRLWHFSSSVNSSSNTHAQPSIGARCLFGRTIRLLPYFMSANSEGSGETVRMRRLAWAFAGRLCDKYHNLMRWLISLWEPERRISYCSIVKRLMNVDLNFIANTDMSTSKRSPRAKC